MTELYLKGICTHTTYMYQLKMSNMARALVWVSRLGQLVRIHDSVADPGGGHNGPVPPPPPPEGPAPTYTRTCTNMCTRTYANTAQRYSYGRNGLYVRLPYVHNDTWVRAKYEYDCIWRDVL